jgi:putative ABC transport system permease protein
MIKHIFKIMWHRKKRNFLLIAQIFFVFFVLFGLLTVIIKSYKTYTQPLGFDYQDVWVVNSSWDAAEKKTNQERVKLVREHLKNDPAVEFVSVASNNYPFSNSVWGYGFQDSTLSFHTYGFWVEPDFFKVFRIPVEGRIYQEGMPAASQLIINKKLVQELGKGDLLGQKLPATPGYSDQNSQTAEVIGTIDHFRYRSSFEEEYQAIFWNLPFDNLDYVHSNMMSNYLMRMKPAATKADERRILENLQQLVPQWEFEIHWLEDLKENKERGSIVPMIIFAIVTFFLISNVALGLFGVLWYNISKRKEEIGVRRAMGATASGIQSQFVVEAIMITSFALIAALFFAVQFPILNVFEVPTGIYWQAIGGSILVTLFITLICALYPSRLAANKQPAMALHEQ